MKLSDIPKFEQQFNLLINIYISEIEFDPITKTQSVTFFPKYITPHIVQNVDDVINLLLIQEGSKLHFVLIKSMSALLRGSYNNNGAHICPCCCVKSYQGKTTKST